MTTRSIARLTFAALMAAGIAMPANAQGKSQSKPAGKANEKSAQAVAKSNGKSAKANDKAVKTVVKADEKRNKARKHVTPPQAVLITREVLVSNGYQIVRVVPTGTTQVIYYRRGNMGNGRGLGPVEKIYVVPAGDVVQFRSVPQSLLATILGRLGM